MSDGSIGSTPPIPPPPSHAVSSHAKIISLPPDMPLDVVVKGDVMAAEQGRLAIKTEQGVIIVETDIPVPVGKEIKLSIQSSSLIAKLILDTRQPLSPMPVSPQITPPSVATADPVRIHQPIPQADFSPISMQLATLPPVSADALPILLKAMLGLSPAVTLSPAIMEGLEKFQLLTSLLSQANLMPDRMLQPSMLAAKNEPSLSSIIQSMKIFVQDTDVDVKNLIQIKIILPGQKVSPDILVQLRQQLSTLIPSPSMPFGAAQSNPTQSSAVPAGKPLLTLPVIGLVVGSVPVPGSAPASPLTTLLMAIPSGESTQSMIGILPRKTEVGNALLPGTVVVATFQPQTQKNLSLPALLAFTPAAIPLTALPLHSMLGDTWPVVEDMWQQALAMKTVHPEMLATLQQTLPTPVPAHLPPALLFLFAALKHHVPWIGDKTLEQLPQITKETLIAQLSKDMDILRARSDDSLPGDAWRPLPMPLQVGDQLLRLQWFYRHPAEDQSSSGQNDEAGEGKRQKTRFLLNVPKTGLGDLQIDGLFHERNLEIILRTERQVTSMTEAAIRKRYHAVLETTGMNGMLHFQSGRDNYVRA